VESLERSYCVLIPSSPIVSPIAQISDLPRYTLQPISRHAGAITYQKEQYSIWPAEKENALGWRDAGTQGTNVECLATSRESGRICAP